MLHCSWRVLPKSSTLSHGTRKAPHAGAKASQPEGHAAGGARVSREASLPSFSLDVSERAFETLRHQGLGRGGLRQSRRHPSSHAVGRCGAIWLLWALAPRLRLRGFRR